MYRVSVIFEFAVMLLTFVKEKFYIEMLATRSLVQIDMVKEKKINCEF